MADIMKKLLLLVKDNNTINEISKELNLTHKQIYNYLTILKNKGYNINKKYYYTGDIIYELNKSFLGIDDKGVNIYTSSSDNKFMALLISDMHIGNRHENIKYIEMMFDYCREENINIILCGGDFIDGVLSGSGKKIYSDPVEQIDYALSVYPQDNNILTFTVLGNHDLSILTKTGQSFAKILENYRHDIISLGYGRGVIHVKNDVIILKHKIDANGISYHEYNPALMIKGHSHRMAVKTTSNNLCIISVPTLSQDVKDKFPPGAVKMILEFESGVFASGHFEQLIIMYNKIIRVNEIECSLIRGKEILDNINLEDETVKRLVR